MKNLKLFANCKTIKGYRRSVITDLQFGEIIPIPNSLENILVNFDGYTLANIKQRFSKLDHSIIEEYFEFLKAEKLIFECDKDEVELFQPLSLDWDFPAIISNAILVYNFDNFKDVLVFLNDLHCKSLLVICGDYSFEKKQTILEQLAESKVKSYDLQFDITSSFNDLQKMVSLVRQYPRLQNLYLNSSFESKIYPLENCNIYFINKGFSNTSCGNISHYSFSINIPFFTESQHYNTCLNRKVCIDEKGFIKNCLSIDKHFGNINEVDLKGVVKSDEFQKLWHIKKDDIKVCQDCEFRHMCMDCRAFIKDKNDIYSQPSKCHYNPYIAKWKGEEGYITVEEWQEQQKVKAAN